MRETHYAVKEETADALPRTRRRFLCSHPAGLPRHRARAAQPRAPARTPGALRTQALSLAELLAIILRTGTRGDNALELTNKLLTKFGGLPGLVRADFRELCAEHGMGAAKSAQVKAALEIGRRLALVQVDTRYKISTPSDAANLVMLEMAYLDTEQIEFSEERRDGSEATIDGEARQACSVLALHERETTVAVDPLEWQGDGAKEHLQVVGVIDPGMFCLTYFHLAQEMVDERGIRGNPNHLTVFIHDAYLDLLVHNKDKRHDLQLQSSIVAQVYRSVERGSTFSI